MSTLIIISITYFLLLGVIVFLAVRQLRREEKEHEAQVMSFVNKVIEVDVEPAKPCAIQYNHGGPTYVYYKKEI